MYNNVIIQIHISTCPFGCIIFLSKCSGWAGRGSAKQVVRHVLDCYCPVDKRPNQYRWIFDAGFLFKCFFWNLQCVVHYLGVCIVAFMESMMGQVHLCFRHCWPPDDRVFGEPGCLVRFSYWEVEALLLMPFVPSILRWLCTMAIRVYVGEMSARCISWNMLMDSCVGCGMFGLELPDQLE